MSKQQQTSLVVFVVSVLPVVVSVCRGGGVLVFLVQSPLEDELSSGCSLGRGWLVEAGRPASWLSRCVLLCPMHQSFRKNMSHFVCLVSLGHYGLKANSTALSQHQWTVDWPLNSFSCFIYRCSVAGCIALRSAIIAAVSTHSPLPSQPMVATRDPNRNVHAHTPVNTSTHILQALRDKGWIMQR